MKQLAATIAGILCIMAGGQLVSAQTINIPDTLQGWDQNWTANLNGSQASYSNWSQGGVNSISGTASTTFTALHRAEKLGYGFRINLRYGQAKISGEGVRKTDDLISIRNRFTWPLDEDGLLSAYASVMFRTQFDKGFEYDAAVNGADSLISDFMAPAYFTEGAGIAYQPKQYLTFEAGLGLKQTYVRDEDLATNYGLDEGETFMSEGGITTGITFDKEIATNIRLSSSVETFTNVMESVSRTDVYWANELIGQINKIVSATFQFELRYDDDFSDEIQLKQVFAAGVTVSLY